MSNEELQLPGAEAATFASIAYPGLEWREDPPPLVARMLPHDILISVYTTKVLGRAKLADLQSQAFAVEASVLNDVAEKIQGIHG